MVLPVAHAMCAAVTVASGVLGADVALVFWLVVVNQGIYDTLKHPIDNASFKVLYQPLKAAQRLAAQIAVEVIFSPVVVGVAGGVMLLFSAGMTYDPVVFSGVLLVNFVLWAVFARAAGRGYRRKLVDNLRRRIEGDVPLALDDATTLAVAARASRRAPSPAEVCVALNMLEKASAPDLHRHARREARRTARPMSGATRSSGWSRSSHRRCASSAPTSRAIRTPRCDASACARWPRPPGSARSHEMAPYLRDPDAVVRAAAVTALFDLGRCVAAPRPIEAVERFAASERAEDRALGARLAGEHGLAEVVRELLVDDRTSTCVARRCGRPGVLRDAAFDELLVAQLVDPHLARRRRPGLAARGEAAIAVLAPRFRAGTGRAMLGRMIEVYRAIGGPPAIAALRAHLELPDARVRGRVLDALDCAWLRRRPPTSARRSSRRSPRRRARRRGRSVRCATSKRCRSSRSCARRSGARSPRRRSACSICSRSSTIASRCTAWPRTSSTVRRTSARMLARSSI